jgi:hypothetical protein
VTATPHPWKATRATCVNDYVFTNKISQTCQRDYSNMVNGDNLHCMSNESMGSGVLVTATQ